MDARLKLEDKQVDKVIQKAVTDYLESRGLIKHLKNILYAYLNYWFTQKLFEKKLDLAVKRYFKKKNKEIKNVRGFNK